MKARVKKELNMRLITTTHQPQSEHAIKLFKVRFFYDVPNPPNTTHLFFLLQEKMSLYLWSKNEQSYKNYPKYITKIVNIMNSHKPPPPEPPRLRALFTLKDFKPTFSANTKVYKLYTPFERKSLPFKQSIQLGE